MIAMAIACKPRLLIADEPTTALDVTIQKQILDLIARLKREHAMSVLFITHDLRVVGEIADDVVVMQSGQVRERGTVAELFDGARDPYTQALLACRPSLERRPARLPVVADFLSGRVAGAHAADALPDRVPRADGDVVLRVAGLSKSFRSRAGSVRPASTCRPSTTSRSRCGADERSASSASRGRARPRSACR